MNLKVLVAVSSVVVAACSDKVCSDVVAYQVDIANKCRTNETGCPSGPPSISCGSKGGRLYVSLEGRPIPTGSQECTAAERKMAEEATAVCR